MMPFDCAAATCTLLLQAARGGDASLGADGLDGPDAFLSIGSSLELALRADIDLADDEETGAAAAGPCRACVPVQTPPACQLHMPVSLPTQNAAQLDA